MHTTAPTEQATIVDAFLDAITSPPRIGKDGKPVERKTVEDDAYLSMMLRMVRALEQRAISNPAILAHVELLRQRLAEVTNVAIAANAARYAINPHAGASAAECGAVLGVSKQAASQRRALGNRIMAERIEAAGAVNFSEAKREREAIDRADLHAADKLGTDRMLDLNTYRARHLKVVA